MVSSSYSTHLSTFVSQHPLPTHSTSSRYLPLQPSFHQQAGLARSSRYLPLQLSFYQQAGLAHSTFCCPSLPETAIWSSIAPLWRPVRLQPVLSFIITARHLSLERTHYSSIFQRQHSILLHAFTVFISIAFALRLGWFLILVQHGLTGSPYLPSWDDWVPQDRIRKMNEDNKALAANLKFEMDKLLRPKAVAATNKKKAAGSDLSSNRGSEERHATPLAGRGQKRGRDFEIEKVRDPLSSELGEYWSSPHGLNGKILALEDEESGLRRSKRLKANPARGAKELLASSSRPARSRSANSRPANSRPANPRPANSRPASSRLATSKPATSRPASSARSHPKPGPSQTKGKRSKAPKPSPAIAPYHYTDDSRIQSVTPAQMKREWTASCHNTASSRFDWDGLHSDIDIPYDKLDEAERKAGFPPPGFRLPDENGNPKPKQRSKPLPPIEPHKHFPRKYMHLYERMQQDVGISWDAYTPSHDRSKRFLKAGVPLEDNTPEDLVGRRRVRDLRDKLIKRSNGRVQFTNRSNNI